MSVPPSTRPLGRRRWAAIACAMALSLAACGIDPGVETLSATQTPAVEAVPATTTDAPRSTDDPTPSSTTTTTPVSTLPSIIEPALMVDIPFEDVVDVDPGKPQRSYDAFVAVAFTDIQRWWAEQYPAIYGEDFAPLDGGVYAGYPERKTSLPGCGEATTPYLELTLYVAFYCEFGDFMVYDDGNDPELDSILAPLAEEFGPAVMGIVLAHEYGHAIQSRIGALDRFLATIITEQQADCFAGAWTGQAYRGESPLLRLGDADVRAGLIAMLSVRDPVGTSQFVPGGHGSAFDRVGAFQEGFIEGPARCAQLLDEPLTLMPNQFQYQEDIDRGGNASYDCTDDPSPDCRPAPDFLAEDLNHFWNLALGDRYRSVTVVPVDRTADIACANGTVLANELAVCPSTRTVRFDEPAVRSLYDEFGDFTIGYFYGIAWAELVQQTIGSTLVGEQRALLNDCLTGAWVRDITPDRFGATPRQADRDGDGEPDSTVRSSPGDLDEAIRMAILEGDNGANVDDVGSPFEKIASFRVGVLGGLDACGVDLA